MRLIITNISDFAVRLTQPVVKTRAWVMVDGTRVVIGRTGTRET